MSPLIALIALISAAAPPLVPHAPPPRLGLRAGLVQVTHLAPGGAFVNRGRGDGLTEGQALETARGARCVVEVLADTTARCRGEGLKVGDVFRFRAPPEETVKEPEVPLHPSLVQRRLALLEAAPLTLVHFEEQPGAPSAPRTGTARWRAFTIELGHTTWTTAGHQDGAYHLESLDVALREAAPLPYLRVNLDAGLRWYSGRPAGFRDSAASPLQLRVREASVALLGGEAAWRVSAGRLWLSGAPGLAMLDGVEGSWAFAKGWEVGAFAGALPEPTLASIAFDRWAAGAWQGWTWEGTGALQRLSQRLRLSVAGLPRLRGEVEATAHAWFAGHVDADLSVRAGVGGPLGSALDGARLAARWRPLDRLLLSTSVRVTGQLPAEIVSTTAPWTGAPGLHGDLAASWRFSDLMVLQLTGAATRDFNAVLGRFWGGPSVLFPRLLPGGGSVSAGWFEEAGFWGRRSIWAEARAPLFEVVRLTGRLTFTQDTPTLGTGAFATPELGGYFAADATLPYGLWARGSVLVRGGFGGGLRSEGTAGALVQLTLGAAL